MADVLRYWLALLRHEEALSARPRARRLGRSARSEPDLKAPVPGQEYLKLPTGSADFCVTRRGELELEPSAEWCAFFEDWLHGRYRATDPEDSEAVSQLIAFPAIHLPRDELGGLLRCPVRASWLTAEGKDLEVPNYRARMAGALPATPARLRLAQAPSGEEEALPFFVDGRILRDVMRVEPERLDELFTKLRASDRVSPRQLVRELCLLLADQIRHEGGQPSPPAGSAPGDGPQNGQRGEDPGADADADELFEALHRLARARLAQLGSKARAYPVALVINTSRNRATFHVQKDIDAALALAQEGELSRGPLREYLGQERKGFRESPLLGRFAGASLTRSQRAAASRALGSTLTAVQGPPGTGKTTVTLNLAAHALVERLAPLVQGHRLPTGLLVVASTNNRAVDNVMGPLAQEVPEDQLPLALRVGSREVVDQVTTALLARTLAWLKRAAAASSEEVKRAAKSYGQAREALEAALGPAKKRSALTEERDLLRDTLARLGAPRDEAAGREELGARLRDLAPRAQLETLAPRPALSGALSSLAERLQKLSELTDPERRASAKKIETHFRYTERHQGEVAEKCLGAPLALGLPPPLPDSAPVDQQRELWEDAAEDALGRILALQRALADHLDPAAEQARRDQLTARLQEIERDLGSAEEGSEAPASAGPDEDPHQALHQALFDAALELRELWARANRTTLLEALSRAHQLAKRSGSLRSLVASPKGPGPWLRRLFPVWGCTLLSLGNNFPAEPGCLDRVVVDEAGQCHGAYAVAALLRARSALVVGDVHQLEPVAALSASEERRVLRGLELSTGPETLAPFRMYEGSGTSAQSIADAAVSSRPTLIDHFRCQPAIAAICEKLCGYGLVTHTPAADCGAIAPELAAPVLFVPVAGRQERFAGSWKNEAELATTLAWARHLLRSGLDPSELGIITPYRGQLEHLWRLLQHERIPLERTGGGAAAEETLSLFSTRPSGVAVGTVHLFQGGERRVILLSTTVTERRSLGFIDQRVNLINVAASRAREHLITLGHTETLRAGQHTRALLEGARRASLPPLDGGAASPDFARR